MSSEDEKPPMTPAATEAAVKRALLAQVIEWVSDPKMFAGSGLGVAIVVWHFFVGASQTAVLLRQIQQNTLEVKVEVGAIVDTESDKQRIKTKELIEQRMAVVRLAYAATGQPNP
jgi:hypothetical protein